MALPVAAQRDPWGQPQAEVILRVDGGRRHVGAVDAANFEFRKQDEGAAADAQRSVRIGSRGSPAHRLLVLGRRQLPGGGQQGQPAAVFGFAIDGIISAIGQHRLVGHFKVCAPVKFTAACLRGGFGGIHANAGRFIAAAAFSFGIPGGRLLDECGRRDRNAGVGEWVFDGHRLAQAECVLCNRHGRHTQHDCGQAGRS